MQLLLKTSSKNITMGIAFFVVILIIGFGCGEDNGVSSEFATISGTITFQNVSLWPDSGEVQITIWPDGVWTENGPIGPPQNPNNPVTLTRNGNQTDYNYILEGLPEGTYSAIAVGWRTPDESVPAEQRSAVLGVYLGTPQVSTGLVIPFPGSPFTGPAPDPITVAKGETRNDVDLLADFANISLFFPPAPSPND